MKKQLIFIYIPLILWMVLIFFLSSIPNLRSSAPDLIDLILRKGAHITEYGILTWLWWRVFSYHKIQYLKAVAIAVGLAILYAISDEYHQTFIYGRHGAATDILIDSVGTVVGIIAIIKLNELCLFKWKDNKGRQD